MDLSNPSDVPVVLDHGYDEKKPTEELGLDDMQKAAKFRGGECTSEEMTPGDLFTPLEWKCAFGHEFKMTPNSVLKGGHWCPTCEPAPWRYDEIAKVNPFLAQVWHSHHGKDEARTYDVDIYKDYDEGAQIRELFDASFWGDEGEAKRKQIAQKLMHPGRKSTIFVWSMVLLLIAFVLHWIFM